MNPRQAHPGMDIWVRFIAGEGEGTEERESLASHLESCSRCTKDTEFLQNLQRARRVPKWVAPPTELSSAARRRPQGATLPPAPTQPRNVRWAPADVRGGVSTASASRMVSRMFPQAELGIVAIPPEASGEWRIEGRVWLREADARAIQVLLVHDDHVIASTEVFDGGYFELEDVVGSGWSLELHLPTGETLRLEDPDA